VDYCYCSEELHNYNMVDYFVDTYKTDLTPKEKRGKEVAVEISDKDTEDDESPQL
jgi:hypothetical protein